MQPTKTIILFLILINIGCIANFDKCDLNKSKAALNSSLGDYKSEILKDASKYTKLKEFLILNLDTLLNYNQKRSFCTTTGVNGKEVTVACSTIDSFVLFNYGTGNNIKDQIPPQLYPELRRIYSSFNKTNFYSVSFQRDSVITIYLNHIDYDDDQIGISHVLEWNTKIAVNRSTILEKDTLLTNGSRYVVSIDCYRGH